MSAFAQAVLIPVFVVTTAYSSVESPGRCRWTDTLPNESVAACPVAWKGYVLLVPGKGVRLCADTGAYDYLTASPSGKRLVHVDLFMADYEDARRHGVQVDVVYVIGVVPMD